MTLNVSPLTLGTSGLGRDTVVGSAEEAEAVSVAVALFGSAHMFLDTSNNYAGGRSEAVIGKAIRQVGEDATARVITKVDRDPRTGAFDRERVLRSFDESIAKLGVDRVPLLHFHDPFTVSFEETVGAGGALEGMIELRESGRVDAIGIAYGPVPPIERYLRTEVFDAVLCHNRYTLVDRSAEKMFAEAKERGMTVFNAAPFGSGLLAKGADAQYHYGAPAPELQDWVRRASAVCDEYGTTLPAVALHFSLRNPNVDSTVVGVARPGRLAQLDELARAVVPDEVWAALDALGPAPSPIDDSAA
ncbi:aldo/keto reductase [Microbacterium sp. C7(2022)]|uniref:aldo/keto reductase n=1 Tax=Microbacterium sp. C7(2022) TaxID=2992759 RepID=UPI00237B49CF|nr:aldo/keto reductase [Microbacterium sp. C7(2022)]MDE0546203.1 aldo/keto reductase [Microbacterium sp. C7(2022)]